MDTDGDAIPARTLPGTHPKGAYFTRGSGHNMYGAYTEDAAEYQAVVDRLRRKFDTAKELVPAPVVHVSDKNRTGILTIGSCDNAAKEARALLAESGVNLNYLRVKGFPFGKAVQDYLDNHERIYVVEQNRDAQLRGLLLLETRVDPNKLVPVLHYDGLPIWRRPLSTASTRILPGEKRHELHRQAEGCASPAAAQRAAADRARLRGGHVHAVRRLRPRLDHRLDHAGSLRAVHSPAPYGQALGYRLFVEDPGVFRRASHGFNPVHGRMPSVATGANAANQDLQYIGVSGDGDTLSIGLGQFLHAVRRNLNMLYLIENNGVYGLTKGQFSASADVGSKAKKGDSNQQPPIDPCSPFSRSGPPSSRGVFPETTSSWCR